MELIPAGCQEVVNKEHLTDPDSAHRGMWVYSAAEATDITKAPREKSSDGNCSGVTSEAERITTLDGLTSPACVTIYIRSMSLSPVWPMPEMAEATTEKEPINEKADCQPLPRLRASGPAGASSPLPLPGAA